MRCACIDIGSNTTRLLVADVVQAKPVTSPLGRGQRVLTEVAGEKAFTRLGSALRRTGALPAASLATLAETVAVQGAVARSMGAERVRVVATAAIRAASNAPALVDAVKARSGLTVEELDGHEEARLAFVGATHGREWRGVVAVVDVGGGSTEIAIGEPGVGVRWAASVPVGSSSLTDAGHALGHGAAQAFAGLQPPPVQTALAVGGSAASTSRLVGARIDAASARAALRLLEAGGVHGIEPERVRLLPAGLAILVAVSELLGLPLTVGRGGLREGICLELAGSTTDG